MTLKIDIHTHILPREIPSFKEKFGYGGFIELDHCGDCRARMIRDDGKFFREVESNCWDPMQRLAEMSKQKTHVQVLSTVPVMFNYWTKAKDGLEIAKFLNDHIAGICNANPKRFVGLGTLPMQDPKLAVKELERCTKQLGLAGVQIGTHIKTESQDWNLNEAQVLEVFAAAESLGASIFVHPWDMMGEAQMQKYWLPWLVGMPAECSRAICSMIFGGVFEKFPKLRVAFAHGGGAFPGSLGRIEHGFEARPDLCAIDNKTSPMNSIGKFYVDSLVHDPKTLKFILDVYGPERIALGSDYPFPLGEAVAGKLIEAMPELSTATKERLLHGSALEWLGKTKKDFE